MKPNQYLRGPSWQKLDRFWAFHDDTDTTTAIDLSFTGSNGSITGGAYREGPYGKALDADGSTTEVTGFTTPSFTDTYTAIAWITPDAVDDGANHYFFIDNVNNQLRFLIRSNGRLAWGHWDTSPSLNLVQTGERSLNPREGREYLAVARWKNENLTLDVGSRKDNISPMTQVDSTSVSTLRAPNIGDMAIASRDGSDYYDGSISGLILSSHYLTDREVLWLDAHLNLVKAMKRP